MSVLEPEAALDAASRRASVFAGGLRPGAVRRRVLGPALVLAMLAVWEGLGRAGWINVLFFPVPSTVAQTAWRLVLSGVLPREVGASLWRVALGFGLGIGIGVPLGLVMGWSPATRAMLEPLVSATYPIPKIALLPLFMLVFGTGEASKIVVIAVGAFFPAAINAMAGVHLISPVYFAVAANCRASRWTTFIRVVVPGALPVAMTGVRLAFGIALLLVVGIEFVAAQTGVGALIWLSWQTLRTETLYAAIAAWAVVGVLSTAALLWLEARLMPWRPRP